MSSLSLITTAISRTPLLVVGILGFAISCSALAATTPFKVLIDPGHGGMDRGAVMNGVKESEVVLKVARALQARLVKDTRFEVLMTREKDQHVSLSQRVQMADVKQADLLLSIHANSSPDPRAKGAEFYFQNQLPPDEEALFLAAAENQLEKWVETESKNEPKKDSDVRSIVEDLKRQHRLQKSLQLTQILANKWKDSQHIGPTTIRQAPFYVISKSPRPAVLVEVGYLTHPVEAGKLSRNDDQERIADRLYASLIQYIGALHSSDTP